MAAKRVYSITVVPDMCDLTEDYCRRLRPKKKCIKVGRRLAREHLAKMAPPPKGLLGKLIFTDMTFEGDANDLLEARVTMTFIYFADEEA